MQNLDNACEQRFSTGGVRTQKNTTRIKSISDNTTGKKLQTQSIKSKNISVGIHKTSYTNS